MEFYNPKLLTDAFLLLDDSKKNLKICAGMTHVLRFYKNFPEELSSKLDGIIHIGDIPSLSECREENGRYVIGATTTISSLASDSYIARYAPALMDAAYATSTPQIRNRRTVGGELAWGSWHSPLMVTCLAFATKIRIRKRNLRGGAGSEETIPMNEFYEGEIERVSQEGQKLSCRKPRKASHDLLVKIILPEESFHRSGTFSFFRALMPKISTENSGVVLAVRGEAQQGVIRSALMVASGVWMNTMHVDLPLEGVKMSDHFIFEKLYSFCERYSFEKLRRSGPQGGPLSRVVFGLLKEGFSGLLGR